MRTPRRATAGLAAALALLTAAQASYTVRSGDTLSAIASRLDVSVSQLVDANGISDPDRIRVGQELEVPGEASSAAPEVEAAAGTTYTVRPGDALSRIANTHGVTLKQLQDANGIADANRIRVGQKLTIPGGVTPAPAPASAPKPGGLVPIERAEAGRIIERVAREYGWNPAFVKALAWQESGWQMTRVSSTGAVGIMQVMPGTGDFVARRLVGRPLDLSDPVDNVTAGVAFLDYLYGLTGGDAEQTLAGYYQGLASVRRNGMYDSTKQYIRNVLALKARF